MPRYFYHGFFVVIWSAWVIYWSIAAAGAKAVVRREPVWSRLAHMGPLIFAAYLLGARSFPWLGLDTRILPHPLVCFWIGAAIAVAGLLHTVWARVHLKGNWSGTVTIKADHELIMTGPYAITRHPIYTGLLAAFLGSGIANGEVRGMVAVVIVFLTLWRKLRLEERWLTEQFGTAYTGYARRVAALIPKVL